MNTKRKKSPRKKTNKSGPVAFTMKAAIDPESVPALVHENIGLHTLTRQLFDELRVARTALEILRAAHSNRGGVWVVTKDNQ